MDTDRRYSDRIAVTCDVVFAGSGVSGEGRVLDVSLPGCLMETLESMKVGDCLQVRLFLPDRPSPLDILLAVVRRVDRNVVGLEFIRSSPTDQVRLRRFVRAAARSEETGACASGAVWASWSQAVN